MSEVRAQVEATVREKIAPMLRVHGGGVELLEVSDRTARLRFTDACTACRLRPLTMAAAIRPRLLEIDGVEEIQVEGVRLSEAALRRFERLGGARYARPERRRVQARKGS